LGVLCVPAFLGDVTGLPAEEFHLGQDASQRPSSSFSDLIPELKSYSRSLREAVAEAKEAERDHLRRLNLLTEAKAKYGHQHGTIAGADAMKDAHTLVEVASKDVVKANKKVNRAREAYNHAQDVAMKLLTQTCVVKTAGPAGAALKTSKCILSENIGESKEDVTAENTGDSLKMGSERETEIQLLGQSNNTGSVAKALAALTTAENAASKETPKGTTPLPAPPTPGGAPPGDAPGSTTATKACTLSKQQLEKLHKHVEEEFSSQKNKNAQFVRSNWAMPKQKNKKESQRRLKYLKSGIGGKLPKPHPRSTHGKTFIRPFDGGVCVYKLGWIPVKLKETETEPRSGVFNINHKIACRLNENPCHWETRREPLGILKMHPFGQYHWWHCVTKNNPASCQAVSKRLMWVRDSTELARFQISTVVA